MTVYEYATGWNQSSSMLRPLVPASSPQWDVNVSMFKVLVMPSTSPTSPTMHKHKKRCYSETRYMDEPARQKGKNGASRLP